MKVAKWIDRYRFAVDSLQILPCKVSFAAGGITVVCPNEQTAKDIKELPAGGVVVNVSTG